MPGFWQPQPTTSRPLGGLSTMGNTSGARPAASAFGAAATMRPTPSPAYTTPMAPSAGLGRAMFPSAVQSRPPALGLAKPGAPPAYTTPTAPGLGRASAGPPALGLAKPGAPPVNTGLMQRLAGIGYTPGAATSATPQPAGGGWAAMADFIRRAGGLGGGFGI